MRAGEIQADKLKQRDVAIATYNRLATEYTDDTVNATEALQRAGKLYEKNKAFQEAVNQYMKVHEKYPGTEGALESLEKSAKLYEKKLKRNDQAIEVLNIIVAEFPDTKNSKKAEKKIKKLNK
jgi:TolA-binding protein